MSEDIRDDNQPRVLACIPVYSGMLAGPFAHFMEMQKQWALAEFTGLYKTKVFAPGPRAKIQFVRNMAVEQALILNATHVLFVDDDFLCPPDTLQRLLAHDVDIVGPLFFRGGGDYAPLIFKWKDKGDQHGLNLWTVDAWEPDTLMEIDAIGTGCLLIKTEVFTKIRAPYFYYPEAAQTRTMDVQFCVRAQKRGIKMYCDTSFECGQLGLQPVITSQNFLEARMRSASVTEGDVHEKEPRPGPEFAQV